MERRVVHVDDLRTSASKLWAGQIKTARNWFEKLKAKLPWN
jgi:hypothetical protein